jgi:hypothetical protein
MAGRSMNLRELGSRGIFLREMEAGDGVSRADLELHKLMLYEMKNNGLTAVQAYSKVCAEHRGLKQQSDRAHGRPLSFCEEPSSPRALADFIRSDRGMPAASRGRFFAIEEDFLDESLRQS